MYCNQSTDNNCECIVTFLCERFILECRCGTCKWPELILLRGRTAEPGCDICFFISFDTMSATFFAAWEVISLSDAARKSSFAEMEPCTSCSYEVIGGDGVAGLGLLEFFDGIPLFFPVAVLTSRERADPPVFSRLRRSTSSAIVASVDTGLTICVSCWPYDWSLVTVSSVVDSLSQVLPISCWGCIEREDEVSVTGPALFSSAHREWAIDDWLSTSQLTVRSWKEGTGESVSSSGVAIVESSAGGWADCFWDWFDGVISFSSSVSRKFL